MRIASTILCIAAVLDLIIAIASYLSNDTSGFRYMIQCAMLTCIMGELLYIKSRVGDHHEH